MKISKYSIIAIVIIGVVLYIIIHLLISSNKKLSEINNMYKVSHDSMITYRNSLGQQVSKSEVLQASNNKYFLQLKSSDSLILQLQDAVKSESKKRREVEVAIAFRDKTISILKDSLTNLVIGGTVEHRGDSTFIYPIYQKIISSRWRYENIKLGKNIFEDSLSIFNEYSIVVGSEPDGWFKRKPYALITNLNPSSETTAMKVYQKTPVTNKTLWTTLKAGAIGIIAGILITKL
jgi:hypothetical protein